MCEHCDWELLIDEIDYMLIDDSCDFARDTLEGIIDWIVEHKHCTDNHKLAVQNIDDSVRDRE